MLKIVAKIRIAEIYEHEVDAFIQKYLTYVTDLPDVLKIVEEDGYLLICLENE